MLGCRRVQRHVRVLNAWRVPICKRRPSRARAELDAVLDRRRVQGHVIVLDIGACIRVHGSVTS